MLISLLDFSLVTRDGDDLISVEARGLEPVAASFVVLGQRTVGESFGKNSSLWSGRLHFVLIQDTYNNAIVNKIRAKHFNLFSVPSERLQNYI